MHSENIIFSGLDLWKAEPGSVLKVCPAAGSQRALWKVDIGSTENAKKFAENMAALKRECLHFHIDNKRDCAGSDEEKRGERGVFASLRGGGGVLAIGDVATLMSPK
jgi:hypothetical protein